MFVKLFNSYKMDALLATNKQPEGTVGVTVFLPKDMHRKIEKMAEDMKLGDFLIECLRDVISQRWAEWLRTEQQKIDNEKAG